MQCNNYQSNGAVEPLRYDSGLICSKMIRISHQKTELQGKNRRCGRMEPEIRTELFLKPR